MKELIYGRIEQSRVPLTPRQLSEEGQWPLESVLDALEALSREGRVAPTRKGGWAIPETIGLCAARVGFLRNGTPTAQPLKGGPALPITYGGMERCMPDDLVLVRPLGEKCQLNAILTRGRDSFAAYVRIERGAGQNRSKRAREVKATVSAIPCDVRIPYDVVLAGNLEELRNDQIALLHIDRYPQGSRPIFASLLRVLGEEDSLSALMRAVAEDSGFATVPDEAVLAEADALPDAVGYGDVAGREDLRSLLTFTIDGSTAKDFDDAVSLEETEGGWRLGVHIADVSHYVRPGSAIDADALERGTSLYLPGLTVPMLPERLSNNLCSLMPHADRLALSLFMQIEEGRVVDHRLVKSVIHSHARLTYQAVNRLFDGDEANISPQVAGVLLNMRTLSRTLRERRAARGAIDLEIDEPEFILDESGAPEDILLQPRGEAERIIEDFMLAANETVAALARSTELPFVYRVHEDPDPQKLMALEALLGSLDLYTHIGPTPHPGVLQGALEQARNHPARDLIRHSLLRAMKKARYCERPLGHYALALKDYCHFTSPIRRYPDLTVHRMLKLLIDGRVDEAARRGGDMADIATECSARESAATTAERQADKIMTAAWMARHLGTEFNGVVSSVTAWGLYVGLPNGAEGLVRISQLDDYYEFDRERSRLVGRATGVTFQPGDRVRVRAAWVSIPLGEINFDLLPPEEETADMAPSD